MIKPKYIHENEIFRFFQCKLSIEKTCKLLDVSQRAVEKWDKGYPIPAYYKKIMLMYAGLELDQIGWSGWKFVGGELISPMGYRFTPEMLDYWAIMKAPDLSEREIRLRELKLRRKRK